MSSELSAAATLGDLAWARERRPQTDLSDLDGVKRDEAARDVANAEVGFCQPPAVRLGRWDAHSR